MSTNATADDLPGPTVKYKVPTTISDDGNPTDSCAFDAERIFRLIEDERHLSAHALYHSIKERIQKSSSTSYTELEANSNEKENKSNIKSSRWLPHLRTSKHHRQDQLNEKEKLDHEKARKLLDANKDVLKKLELRCELFEKARHNLNVDDDWTLAQTLFGITTFYRREPDGSLSIKLEGTLRDVPLFDQVAVLREIDLHSRWAPFCSSSLTIAHLDKLDTVGWFAVGLPNYGLMRDGCFRAIGCDSIYEDGSVLLVAQGIADRPEDGADNKHLKPSTPNTTGKGASSSSDNPSKGSDDANDVFNMLSKDPILETLDIPPPPTRMGSGRMTIRTFQALIHIESPTFATSKLVTNIDPNLPLIPQSLLDFLMKRLCGVLLNKLQTAAKKVSRDPVTNPHAIKMREEKDFYKGWLLPKFEGVCKIRGWEMPPISAFQLSEAQMDLANEFVARKKRKTERQVRRLYHTMSDDDLDDYFLDGCEVRSVAGSEPANIGVRNNKCEPKVRAFSADSDDLSDLSRSSASIWSSNPISAYLREIEEKTQIRKEREIEKSRQRAADRLKPKALDDGSRSRLEELRVARNRRTSVVTPEDDSSLINSNSNSVMRNINLQQTEQNGRCDWAVFWTKHGNFTRVLVIQILMSSLFILLYLDAPFQRFVTSREGTFWVDRGRDAATVAYLVGLGWLHFILCYVALMYSFSSLQLGAIAGKQAKKYYSQNVHWVVGITSASMLLMGIAKAGSTRLLHWIVWRAYLLCTMVEGSVSPLQSIPIATVGTFRLGFGRIWSIFSLMKWLVLDSNVVGRYFESIFDYFSGIVLDMIDYFWMTFVESAISQYQGIADPIPWREDAFVTTRFLLSHSATFLLALLFLFNMSARHARQTGGNRSLQKSNSETNDSQENVGGKQVEPKPASVSNLSSSTSSSSSMKGKRRLRTLTRSLSPIFDTIEEDEVLVDVQTADPGQMGGGQEEQKTTTTTRRGSQFLRTSKSSPPSLASSL